MAVCWCLSVSGCDRAERERIHAENLTKSEVFKREFDEHLPAGTPLAAVEEWLRTKPVSVQRSIGYNFGRGRDFVNRLLIEVANEKSLIFGCGRHSVGLHAHFTTEERLEKSEVTSWSFDCM